MKFKKSYFTKESFQGVGLDIDKAYRLLQFLRPLIELYKRDGILLESDEMRRMLIGDIRQPWLTKDKNTNHYLFLARAKVDGNTHYIVNKNFDWLWYSAQCESKLLNSSSTMENNSINELELLRIIAGMINKHFHKYCSEEWDDKFPDDIKNLMNIWNEKFNRCGGINVKS